MTLMPTQRTSGKMGRREGVRINTDLASACPGGNSMEYEYGDEDQRLGLARSLIRYLALI